LNATEGGSDSTGCFTGGQLRQLELERYRPPRTLLTACGDDDDANDLRRVTELPECGVMLMMRGTTRAHFDDDGAVGWSASCALQALQAPAANNIRQSAAVHARACDDGTRRGTTGCLQRLHTEHQPLCCECAVHSDIRVTVTYALRSDGRIAGAYHMYAYTPQAPMRRKHIAPLAEPGFSHE